MLFVYASFPILNNPNCPEWVEPLAQKLEESSNITLRNPWLTPHEEHQRRKCFDEWLKYDIVLTDTLLKERIPQKLHNIPNTQTLSELENIKNLSNIVERELYFILRSDLVIADFSLSSHGGLMAIMYAFILGIPIIGINNTEYITSPWVNYHTLYITSSVDIKQLTRLTTSMLLTNEYNFEKRVVKTQKP